MDADPEDLVDEHSASDEDQGFADLASLSALRQHLRSEEIVPVDEATTEDAAPEHMRLVPFDLEQDIQQDDVTSITCESCGAIRCMRRIPGPEGHKAVVRRRGHLMLTCEACSAKVKVPGKIASKLKVPGRLWCSIYLKMKHPTFELVPMIIGRAGCNVRRIAEDTDTKVRVRGQGSGHLEFPSGKEAPAPLMVVVSTEGDNVEGFKKGVQQTVELLQTVELRFKQHCSNAGAAVTGRGFIMGPPLDKRKAGWTPGGKRGHSNDDMDDAVRALIQEALDAMPASASSSSTPKKGNRRAQHTESVHGGNNSPMEQYDKPSHRRNRQTEPVHAGIDGSKDHVRHAHVANNEAHEQHSRSDQHRRLQGEYGYSGYHAAVGQHVNLDYFRNQNAEYALAGAGYDDPRHLCWTANESGVIEQSDPWANYAGVDDSRRYHPDSRKHFSAI